MFKKILSTAILSLTIFTTTFSADSPVQYFDFPQGGQLTTDMRTYYETNGFLILNDYLTPPECGALITESKKLISEFQPTPETLEIFSADTPEGASKRGSYFKDSADKISFFFESKAFEEGQQIVPTLEAINKIGHALGELNDTFREVTFRTSISHIATQLGITDPRLNQSMFICKSAKIGGEVYPHQDSTFLYTNPDTTTAFWIPLEDATQENGCLWAIPGSHTWPLFSRYISDPDKPGYCFIDGEENRLSDGEVTKLLQSKCAPDAFVNLPMKQGSIIIFPGKLVHGSSPNLSDKSRNAYTFHVIGGDSEYPANNWLQRPTFVPLTQ